MGDFDFNTMVDVKETDQGEAIPTTQFDFSTAESMPEASPSQPPRVSVISKVARAIFKNTPAERLRTALYINEHINEVPDVSPTDSPWDYGKKMEDFLKPREEEIMKLPLMEGSLKTPMEGLLSVGMATSAIRTTVGVGAYMVKDHFFNLRRFVDEKFPNTAPEIKDIAELADLAVFGGLIHKGMKASEKVPAIKSFMDLGDAMAVPRNVNISPDIVGGIKDSGNFTLEEKIDLMKTIGIEQEHIDAAIAGGVPINVPTSKIMELATKPYWEIAKHELLGGEKGEAPIELKPEIPTAPSETAPSVASYVNAAGEKIYTKLTPEEFATLRNEPLNIPSGQKGMEGASQLHLDAITPSLEKIGKEVSREEFISGHPQAEEMFKPTLAQKQPQGSTQTTKVEIGSGGILNTKESVDFTARREITSQMPFTLLGNKAEVIARMPLKLKAELTKGVKNVYDLWGGSKGYRIGLFKDVKSENYHLNEFSNERSSYYKHAKDPVAHKTMIDKVTELKNGLMAEIAKAFDIDPAKYTPEYLKQGLNKWMSEGMSKEKYQYVRNVVQNYGEKILKEATSDNFASPESAAKYYFLENTATFGLKQDSKGYSWSQGLIKTSKGKSSLKEAITRLENAGEIISAEHARDKNINLTKEDAWVVMDKLVDEIKSGKVNPKETAVMVDPQYLNPSGEEGTYSVGRSDTTWAGHKQNLEQHLLPLIKTGAKIIYTNNMDPKLAAWLKENKIPYNVETGIGASFGKGGRDEVISIINYEIPEGVVTGNVGNYSGSQPGEGGLFGGSESFKKWLETNEGKITGSGGGVATSAVAGLVKNMKELASTKELSQTTVTALKKFLGVENLRKASEGQIAQMTKMIGDLQTGDKFLSEKTLKGLESITKDLPVPEITPKRIIVEQFGDKSDILSSDIIEKNVDPRLVPTVDIKKGHPLVKKITDKVDDVMIKAHAEIRRRDMAFEDMIKKAEKSREPLLDSKEKLSRKVYPQNKEIWEKLGGSPYEITKEEAAVVAYLRNFFSKAKEDLKLEKWREKYVTHMEKPFIEKILNGGLIKAVKDLIPGAKKNELPIDIQLELDNIIGSEKYFKYAQERKGGVNPTTNLRQILHDYSTLYETKKALDQILPEGQAVTRNLLQGKSAVWMKQFLQNLKGRGMDSNFKNGPMGWLGKTADAIVDVGYLKMLGLNWKSALKNIVAGESNAWIYQDFPTYLKGKERFFSNPNKAYEMATRYGALEGTYSDFAQKGIGQLKKYQDLMMVGQKAGEIEIRSSIFASMLNEKEWKTGEIEPGRFVEIKDVIAKTQGIFSKWDSPLLLQTWYGRMFFQMNRWRITNAMLLKGIVQDASVDIKAGNYKTQNVSRLGKALVAYGTGMYISYQLSLAGYRTASDVAKNMAQTIDGILSLFTEGDLIKMFTDNPTLSTLGEISNTIQNTAKYLHVPGAKKTKEEGIEDTYIAPVEGTKDLLESLNE